jgi:large subunit ribosomal protein L29
VRAKELRERTAAELVKLLDEAKDSLFRKKLKNTTHQLDKTSELGLGRREIARIKTILNERRASLATEKTEE